MVESFFDINAEANLALFDRAPESTTRGSDRLDPHVRLDHFGILHAFLQSKDGQG